MANCDNACIIYCNQHKHQRSIKWYPNTNTGHLWSAASAYQYHVFESTVKSGVWLYISNENFCFKYSHAITPDNKDHKTVPHTKPDELSQRNEVPITITDEKGEIKITLPT